VASHNTAAVAVLSPAAKYVVVDQITIDKKSLKDFNKALLNQNKPKQYGTLEK